jgi:hypothetical protein
MGRRRSQSNSPIRKDALHENVGGGARARNARTRSISDIFEFWNTSIYVMRYPGDEGQA